MAGTRLSIEKLVFPYSGSLVFWLKVRKQKSLEFEWFSKWFVSATAGSWVFSTSAPRMSLKFFKVQLFSQFALCRHENIGVGILTAHWIRFAALRLLKTLRTSQDAISLNDKNRMKPLPASNYRLRAWTHPHPSPAQDLQRNIHDGRCPIKTVNASPPYPNPRHS